MSMSCKNLLWACVALGVWISSGVVRADFIFGGTGTGVPQNLIVSTTTGEITLHTGMSEFTFGVPNHGWWSATDFNNDPSDNYIVGSINGNSYNNFFTFDTRDLRGLTIQGARLELESGVVLASIPKLHYGLFDVSTDPVALNFNDGTSAAIFDDLGTGVSYGSFAVPGTASNQLLSFNLNADGVAGLIAAADTSDFFSIGGTLLATSPVPEPSSVTLLAIGGIGIACGAMRRRRHSVKMES